MPIMEILTATSVVLTGVYAFLTYKILQANQRVVRVAEEQTAAMIRPYVHFELNHVGPIIEGLIKNTGKTPAHRVHVRLSPDIVVFLAAQSKSFSSQLSFLAPDRAFDEFLGTITEITEQNPSLIYEGSVSYADNWGREYEESFRIDLNSRTGTGHVGRKNVGDELAKLNDTVKAAARSLAQIQDQTNRR